MGAKTEDWKREGSVTPCVTSSRLMASPLWASVSLSVKQKIGLGHLKNPLQSVPPSLFYACVSR